MRKDINFDNSAVFINDQKKKNANHIMYDGAIFLVQTE